MRITNLMLQFILVMQFPWSRISDRRLDIPKRLKFLTQELDNQLSSWLTYRYRKRRICYSENGKTVTQYRTPIMKDSDLVFSAHRLSGNPNPVSLYVEFGTSFAKTLDRMGTRKTKGEHSSFLQTFC